jgi:hypothetical protein
MTQAALRAHGRDYAVFAAIAIVVCGTVVATTVGSSSSVRSVDAWAARFCGACALSKVRG